MTATYRQVGALASMIVCAITLSFPGRIIAQESRSDSVTAAQDAGGFNSLTDGQPISPGAPQFGLTLATLRDKEYAIEWSMAFTLDRVILHNSLFGLIGPTLDAGEGATDFERSVSVIWLQRWIYEQGLRPTFATQLSIQVPYDEPDAGIDAVLTVVTAHGLGPGTVYLNAYGETQNKIELAEMEWGGLVGYKSSFTSSFFMVGDVLLQTESRLTLEISPVYELSCGLSLGPGIGVEWDLRDGGVVINVGLELEYSKD